MDIQEILSRLHNVKTAGQNQWQASCPCSNNHQNGDEHRSLSIGIGDDGRTLLNCFTGCQTDEICAAIGISVNDLFADNKAMQAQQTAQQAAVNYYTQKQGLKFVAAYSYDYGTFRDGMTKLKFYDKDGNKTFRWIHNNPTDTNRFSTGQDGCKHRLFIAGNSNDDLIVITEGEKDAITAHKALHCTAASAENGATKGDAAGGKWRQEYNEQLTGKTVYILHDNDEAGRHFARLEAEHINKFAERVYVIDITAKWDGCPEKGDISDMVAALGAEQVYEIFTDLTTEARPLPKTKEEAIEQGLIKDPFTEFLEKIQTEAYKPYKTGLSFFDDLLGGGVVQQSLITVLAAPGMGKTSLCQQIAEEMASRQQEVIYFNLEMSREQMFSKALSYWMAKKRQYYTTLQILQGYNWKPDERTQIEAAAKDYLQKQRPYINYNPENVSNNLDEILNYLGEIGAAAKLAGKQAPAVVIDYLHLLGSNQKTDIQELIKQAVFGLKRYAKDYNTFVIAISATNRTSSDSGKISLSSGRDSSNLEYTADYVLSLNYYAIEKENKNANDPEEMAAMQSEDYRRLILRVLKGRMSAPGKNSNIYFDAAHNIFYGSGDWMPADAARVPFKDEQPIKANKNIPTI